MWRQIGQGELVLRWAKGYTAAPHEFEVIYHPEQLTDAQLRMVLMIQEELAEQWDGRSGMSGNTSSPPVSKGWGLNKPTSVSEQSCQKLNSSELADDLAALMTKFGRGVK